jgi:hypothetical protein
MKRVKKPAAGAPERTRPDLSREKLRRDAARGVKQSPAVGARAAGRPPSPREQLLAMIQQVGEARRFLSDLTGHLRRLQVDIYEATPEELAPVAEQIAADLADSRRDLDSVRGTIASMLAQLEAAEAAMRRQLGL